MDSRSSRPHSPDDIVAAETRVGIDHEADIVAARQKGRELAAQAGFPLVAHQHGNARPCVLKAIRIAQTDIENREPHFGREIVRRDEIPTAVACRIYPERLRE